MVAGAGLDTTARRRKLDDRLRKLARRAATCAVNAARRSCSTSTASPGPRSRRRRRREARRTSTPTRSGRRARRGAGPLARRRHARLAPRRDRSRCRCPSRRRRSSRGRSSAPTRRAAGSRSTTPRRSSGSSSAAPTTPSSERPSSAPRSSPTARTARATSRTCRRTSSRRTRWARRRRSSRAEHEHLTCEVLATRELDGLGMGALTAVGRGSRNEPRLIVLRYDPPGARDDIVLGLVGKSITFDAGGISIKPSGGMQRHEGRHVRRRRDAARDRRARRARHSGARVAALAAAENLPGGDAFRPGDILRAANGKTIEIINTDAEGRLVLADALWYVRARGRDARARPRDADRSDGARPRRPLRRRVRERRAVGRARRRGRAAQRRPRLALSPPSALPPLHRLGLRGHEERLHAAPGLRRRSPPSSCTSSPATARGATSTWQVPRSSSAAAATTSACPAAPGGASGSSPSWAEWSLELRPERRAGADPPHRPGVRGDEGRAGRRGARPRGALPVRARRRARRAGADGAADPGAVRRRRRRHASPTRSRSRS